MPTAGQIRGALLEVAVLHLLEKVGYKVIRKRSDTAIGDGLRDGHSGLDVEGRGSWHQIDALAEWEHSPAFVHPIRLLVEGKCYDKRVGIDVVRNAVGVLKDISENHFNEKKGRKGAAASVRYNYLSAIFSATDYTSGAVEYAIAHQIFLIEYAKVPLIAPIIEAIKRVDKGSFTLRTEDAGAERLSNQHAARRQLAITQPAGDEEAEPETQSKGDKVIGLVRKAFTGLLMDGEFHPPEDLQVSQEGRVTVEEIQRHLAGIEGSYFGMLNGRWPMHFIQREVLPPNLFRESDAASCKVFVTGTGLFRFEPEHTNEGQPGWFRLEAAMPDPVKKLIFANWTNDRKRLNAKLANFSFLTLSGKIGGIQRQVRLELSNQWIQELLNPNPNTPHQPHA